jgi:hypothetical protein
MGLKGDKYSSQRGRRISPWNPQDCSTRGGGIPKKPLLIHRYPGSSKLYLILRPTSHWCDNRQPGKNRTARTGQPDWTPGKGQTARTWRPEHDSKDSGTARTWQQGQNSRDKTVKGQQTPVHDSRDRTVRTVGSGRRG